MPFKDQINLAEFNALQETDRVLYLKKDGENGAEESYTLHPSFVAERTALTANNATLKTEKQRAADEARAYKELGLTPEQITELKAAKETADAAKLTDEQKKLKAEEALKTAHKQELTKVQNDAKAREDFLTKELRRNMIEAVAKAAIAKAGVIEGGEDVLLPHVMASMDMLEDGEGDEKKVVTRIIDPLSKQPQYVGSEFMSPDQLVEGFKKKSGFMGVFKASGVGGGGTPPQKPGSTGPGVQMKRAQFDALDMNARAEHIKSGGTVVD